MKKALCNKLVSKVEGIENKIPSTTGLHNKSQCDTDKKKSIKNIEDVDNKWISTENSEYKWFWQRWIQNINRVFFLPKDEFFFFLIKSFGINCFYWDLKVGNIVFVSLLRQSLDNP